MEDALNFLKNVKHLQHRFQIATKFSALPYREPSVDLCELVALPGVATGLAWTPVGGIKEKALAAMRADIARVLLPARNRCDLEEIRPQAKEKLEFVFLDTVDDALSNAMDGASAAIGSEL